MAPAPNGYILRGKLGSAGLNLNECQRCGALVHEKSVERHNQYHLHLESSFVLHRGVGLLNPDMGFDA